MPAVLPPTASSAPLLYSLYLVLPAYLRCARGVILQHEGHCKFCSWAWLETLDLLPPEEEKPKGHFVRNCHRQTMPSSRALMMRRSPLCGDSSSMAALEFQVRGVAGSVVTRKEGSHSLGSLCWWPPRG